MYKRQALKSAISKSGGSGNNYPDIQILLENNTRRNIPVMIEAKGSKNKLEKFVGGALRNYKVLLIGLQMED